MGDIKIDSKAFHDRLSRLTGAWKNDLRTKDGVFNGASSIIVMMGKVEEVPELHKNNAMHVSCLPPFLPSKAATAIAMQFAELRSDCENETDG